MRKYIYSLVKDTFLKVFKYTSCADTYASFENDLKYVPTYLFKYSAVKLKGFVDIFNYFQIYFQSFHRLIFLPYQNQFSYLLRSFLENVKLYHLVRLLNAYIPNTYVLSVEELISVEYNSQ